MDEETRRMFLRDRCSEVEVDAILDHLSGAIECGSLGEQALKSFATTGATEFSVSFVSMAAAVLAVGRLLQVTVFEDTAPERTQVTSLNFRNLKSGNYALAHAANCAFTLRHH